MTQQATTIETINQCALVGDHFGVFGVDPHKCKDQQEVRAAFLRLSLLVHPDRPGGQVLAFSNLNAAKSSLLDISPQEFERTLKCVLERREAAKQKTGFSAYDFNERLGSRNQHKRDPVVVIVPKRASGLNKGSFVPRHNAQFGGRVARQVMQAAAAAAAQPPQHPLTPHTPVVVVAAAAPLPPQPQPQPLAPRVPPSPAELLNMLYGVPIRH